jgi:NAD+-dependent farnesol dehydrogenase
MKILVTGGSGYLGGAIVAALGRRGHEAVVFARTPQAGAGVRAVRGDVTDAAALARAARDVDAICHSAALVSVWQRDRSRFDAVNVGGLRNAIAAAKAAGHDRFVYTSSFLALPPRGSAAPVRGNDYQRTKAEAGAIAEQAARDGFPVTRLYPGVVYGPSTRAGDEGARSGQAPDRESDLVGRLIQQQLTRTSPGIVGGERLWSFAWLDDVAEAHVTALERGGAAAYMLGGENLPQRRLYEIVHAETGAPIPRALPPWIARAAGVIELARARVTGRPPAVTPATVVIFEHDWPLDSTDAAETLNYRITPLVEGLRRLLAANSPDHQITRSPDTPAR